MGRGSCALSEEAFDVFLTRFPDFQEARRTNRKTFHRPVVFIATAALRILPGGTRCPKEIK